MPRPSQIPRLPGGRLAFVVHPAKNQVHILDSASNRIVQTADVEAEPDQVAFSEELAYVRHRGSEIVLMIPLKAVGEPGRPVPLVDFTGGVPAQIVFSAAIADLTGFVLHVNGVPALAFQAPATFVNAGAAGGLAPQQRHRLAG